MESKENNEFLKKLAKEEYEVGVYGFTLKDFQRENFRFVGDKISLVMDFMNDIFFKKINNISSETKEEIREATRLVANNIRDDCKENIEKLVNTQIEKLLTIPDNVVMHEDRIQLFDISEKNLKTLENEVDELKKRAKENATFICLLRNEWNSYAIDDTLELESKIISWAEEYLHSTFNDTNILLNDLKKLATE